MKKLLILTLLASFLTGCDKFGPQGNKKKAGIQEVAYTSDGDTIVKEYDENGILKSAIQIKDGFRNGPCYSYYDNGKVQYEINYNEGRKDSLSKSFHRNGNLYRQTNYDMGQIQGNREYYYEDSKPMAIVPFENGQVVPGTIEYDKNGTIISDYPDIIIRPIDKMAFENKYILEFSLDPKRVKVDYMMFKKIDGKLYPFALTGKTKGGIAKHVLHMPPGRSIMEKIYIRATFKSKRGITVCKQRSYNLVAENRS